MSTVLKIKKLLDNLNENQLVTIQTCVDDMIDLIRLKKIGKEIFEDFICEVFDEKINMNQNINSFFIKIICTKREENDADYWTHHEHIFANNYIKITVRTTGDRSCPSTVLDVMFKQNKSSLRLYDDNSSQTHNHNYFSMKNITECSKNILKKINENENTQLFSKLLILYCTSIVTSCSNLFMT